MQEYDAKADIWSVGCVFYEMLGAFFLTFRLSQPSLSSHDFPVLRTLLVVFYALFSSIYNFPRYLSVVGAPPFKGSNPRELFQNIRTKPLQIPNDVTVGPQSVSLLKKVDRRSITYLIFFQPERRTFFHYLILFHPTVFFTSAA